MSKSARARRLSSPPAPGSPVRSRKRRVKRTPLHSDSSAGARGRALKSRGHSLSVLLRCRAPRRQRLSRRRGSARTPQVASRRRSSAGRTRMTVPSSAARGGLAPAQVQQPVRAERSGAERTSSPPSSVRRLLSSSAEAASGGKLCKSSLRDPGPLVPCPRGQESSLPLQPLAGLPRRLLSALSAAPAPRGSPPWGRLAKGFSGRSPKHQRGSHWR